MNRLREIHFELAAHAVREAFLARPLILHIAKNHSFTQKQVDELAKLTGQPVDVMKLAKLPFPVAICYVEHGQDNDFLFVDHPHAW